MNDERRAGPAIPPPRDWVLEALYGADDEIPQLCAGCGEEMADPLNTVCPACKLAGLPVTWIDESLLNP